LTSSMISVRVRCKSLIALVFCLVASTPSDSCGDVHDIVNLLGRDARYLYENTLSLSLSRDRMVEFLSFTSMVAGLAVNKREVQRELKLVLPGDTDGALGRVEFLGDGGVAAGIGALFIVGGLETGSPREVDTGVMIFESYLFTGFVTVLSQFVLAEERPRNGGEMRFFKPDGHGVSGHAALTASLVCPITHQYLGGDPSDGRTMAIAKNISRALVWSLPVLTGISRIERDEHYLWNVVLGLTTGYTVGHLIARSHEEMREDAGDSRRTCTERGYTRPGRICLRPCSVSYTF